MYNDKFWTALDSLIGDSEIVIDRPKNTAHPKHMDIIYPVDYGYLKNTTSPDNAGIDVYVGSAKTGVVDAVICTVDLCKMDSEIKILIGCSEDEKEKIYRMYSQCYDTLQGVLIRR